MRRTILRPPPRPARTRKLAASAEASRVFKTFVRALERLEARGAKKEAAR